MQDLKDTMEYFWTTMRLELALRDEEYVEDAVERVLGMWDAAADDEGFTYNEAAVMEAVHDVYKRIEL